jgi:hypothetical protein
MTDAKILSLIAATLVMSAGPTMAQEKDTGSANFLLSYCHEWLNNKKTAMPGVCIGVVTGVLETAPLLEPRFRFCPPTTATRDQALRVVVKYLDSNPDKLHELFTGLVIVALREAWPCK